MKKRIPRIGFVDAKAKRLIDSAFPKLIADRLTFALAVLKPYKIIEEPTVDKVLQTIDVQDAGYCIRRLIEEFRELGRYEYRKWHGLAFNYYPNGKELVK